MTESEILDWIYNARKRSIGQFVCQFSSSYARLPSKSIYVVTGPQSLTHYNSYIGYVVQIRPSPKGDIWLVRHPNGKLMQHSNQIFFELSSDDISVAREHIFPQDIQPNLEAKEPYTLGNDFPETSFIVPYYESFHERVAQSI